MTHVPRKRSRERGNALLVTMIVIASLLSGAAVLVSMQLASSRSSDITRTGLSSMFCAEAGLAAARPLIANNYSQWGAALLAGPVEPSWLVTGIGSHDLDGDGQDDFVVFLKDNDDEQPPALPDPTSDADLRVFVVSRCLKYADTQQEVEELVQFSGGGTCYKSQEGGCEGNGNDN